MFGNRSPDSAVFILQIAKPIVIFTPPSPKAAEIVIE